MTDPLGGSWDAEKAYDRMAAPRARLLGDPWPTVGRFIGGLPRGALVLDVGAGNGRYFGMPESLGLRWIAVDLSREQLKLARRSLPPQSFLLRADGRALPVRRRRVDAALAVAVVHHLQTRGDRVALLHEIAESLRPGAPWLASAWSDTAAFARRGRLAEGGGPRDVLIPFREGLSEPVDRFFHLYADGELAAEAAEAGLGRVGEVLEAENRFASGFAAGRT